MLRESQLKFVLETLYLGVNLDELLHSILWGEGDELLLLLVLLPQCKGQM